MGEHTKVKKASNKKFYWWERRWKRRIDVYVYSIFIWWHTSSARSECECWRSNVYRNERLSEIYQMLFVAHRCLSMNFACALDKFNLARHGYDTLYAIFCNAEPTFAGTDTETYAIHIHEKPNEQTHTHTHPSTHACIQCLQIYHYKPLQAPSPHNSRIERSKQKSRKQKNFHSILLEEKWTDLILTLELYTRIAPVHTFTMCVFFTLDSLFPAFQ